jgi:uncharacterized SAM-binding protein YcdF (DUF218 family)
MSTAARRQHPASRTVKIAAVTVAGFLIFLPFAGRFLVRADQLEKADVIFVLGGSRVERWLEAVDLYKEGWAPRIVLSPGFVEPAEATLRERGMTFPREGDLARQGAIAMGVPATVISVLPDLVDNTAEEAVALGRMFPSGESQRVIVVTSGYHTRRAGFAFRRQFAGTPVHVIMRASRHSVAQPSRWWRSRSDIRFVLSELPKLAAYLAGLAD